MKKSTRRILAFLSAAAMALSLAACSGNDASTGGNEDIPEGKLFAPDTEVSLVIGSHNSWPYDKDWKVWQLFRDAVGGKIDITSIPNENLETKVNLMLASPETLPDLIHCNDGKRRIADANASTGAFISLDDRLEEMPNFTKFFDSMNEVRRNSLLSQRKSGDGKIYYAPVAGTDYLTGLRSWLYRKDIFDKHNLSTPKNMDELYDVCMELKKIYPDSYPLCFRQGLNQINIIAPAWRSGLKYGIFYDFVNEKWSIGALEPELLDMVKFFIKMRDAGLVPPDYLTIDMKNWETIITTDRGFIMPDYMVRIDFFNLPARKEKPNFTFAVMTPPESGNEGGQRKISKPSADSNGYLICNTGDEKRISNAVKLIDWFYSDEGSDLMSWGIEGETYEVMPDGSRQFILNGEEDAQGAYGYGTQGTYLRMDPAAQLFTYSEELRAQVDAANANTEDNATPASWLAFNEEEQDILDEYGNAMTNFIEEELSKFMLGQRPLSEWDAFVEDVKTDMNAQIIIDTYDAAYNRAMGK